MASFYQDVKTNVKAGFRESFEENTGIIGAAFRERREKRERDQEIKEQVVEIKKTSKKVARYNATLTITETSFLQIAKNFQSIAEVLKAMPVELNEVPPIVQKKKQETAQVAEIAQELPKPEEDDRLFDKLFNLLDIFKRRLKAKASKKKPPKKKSSKKKPPRKKPKVKKGQLSRLFNKMGGAKFAGRALGVAGVAVGAYEASKFLKETKYGERMAEGQGKAAEKAFKQKNTDFSQLELTQQQAQDILAAGVERDIVAFGGRERLEKIAGVQKVPETKQDSSAFEKVQKEDKTSPVGQISSPAPPPPPQKVPVQTPEIKVVTPPEPVAAPAVVTAPPVQQVAAPTQTSVVAAPPPPMSVVAAPPPPPPPAPTQVKIADGPPLPTAPPEPTKQAPLTSVVTAADSGVDMSKFDPELEKRVSQMAAAFFQQTGKKLMVTSGYRSNEKQKQLWDAKVAELGGNEQAAAKWVARPMPPLGTGKGSSHLRGLAIDINSKGAGGINVLAGSRDSPTGWLEKFGLGRPVKGEDWHVQISGSSPTPDNPTNPGAPIQLASKDGRPIDPSSGETKPLPKEPGTGRELLSQSQQVAAAKPKPERGQTVVVQKTTTVNQINTPPKTGRVETMTAVG